MTHLPQLAHAIDASIAALEKYMAESHKTTVYALEVQVAEGALDARRDLIC